MQSIVISVLNKCYNHRISHPTLDVNVKLMRNPLYKLCKKRDDSRIKQKVDKLDF